MEEGCLSERKKIIEGEKIYGEKNRIELQKFENNRTLTGSFSAEPSNRYPHFCPTRVRL
jgi:hypothetical protein